MKSGVSRDRTQLFHTLGPVLAGLFALGLYGSTAAPGLTWANEGADGGDLIAAAMTWGVPHPSGYPTYCLLARLYALLPFGSFARRFNLFSATAAALSTLLVYLCVRTSLGSTDKPNRGSGEVVTLCAALFWAGGQTLWSQAVITEVYALAAAFMALCLYVTLKIYREERPRMAKTGPRPPACEQGPSSLTREAYSTGSTGRWALLGLALGLGLGAHLTLALLLPGLVALLWRRISLRSGLVLVCSCLLGLSVFLYIPLAAAREPLVNWGDARTWQGFWWLVSGRPYRRYLLGVPWRSWWNRSLALWSLMRAQFSALGLVLALVGLSQPRRGQPPRLATALIFLCYGLYALSYDTADSYIYLIPAYLAMILWIAEGLLLVKHLAERYLPQHGETARRVCLIACLAIPLVSAWVRYPEMDLSHERGAQQWLAGVVALLPPQSLVITGEDRHTFALDYLLWVEGKRRDVLVIDGELLPYAWYRDQLARRYPGLQVSETDLVQFLKNVGRDRPVFLSSLRPELVELYRAYPYTEFWRLEAQNGL